MERGMEYCLNSDRILFEAIWKLVTYGLPFYKLSHKIIITYGDMPFQIKKLPGGASLVQR